MKSALLLRDISIIVRAADAYSLVSRFKIITQCRMRPRTLISYTEFTGNFFMAALCNRAGLAVYIFILSFVLLSFFSSPNLSGRRLDVCHTSTHGVALVRI